LRLAEALNKVDEAEGKDDQPDHLAMGEGLGFAEHINAMSIEDAISKLELARKAELEVADPQARLWRNTRPSPLPGPILRPDGSAAARRSVQMQEAADVLQQLEEDFEAVIQFILDCAFASVCKRPWHRLWPRPPLLLSPHRRRGSRSACLSLRSGQ